MAIEIPHEVEIVMSLYSIPWPDVDEDAFEHIKQPLRDFGQNLDAVTEAIDSALRLLESGNPSQTLTAVVNYLAAIRNEFLSPIKQVCDDLAGWPCDATYDAITSLKLTLLSMLLGEVANDAIDLVATVWSLGAAAPATMAEAFAVREMVSIAAQVAEGEISSLLQKAADERIDNFVNSLVTPFIDQMSGLVESRVNAYAPHLALQTAFLTEQASSGAGQRIHLSPHDLEQCVESIATSSDHLYSAISKLEAAIEEIFSHPAANIPHIPSVTSALRTMLKSVMDTLKENLFEAVKRLIERVVQHFTTLLQEYRRALEELDAQARDLAAKQHAGPGAAVSVLPAAGVAIAAGGGVATASGLANSEKADQVRVEAAVGVDGANPLVVSVAKTPVAIGESATATNLGGDLHVRKDASNVKVGAVTSSGPNVEGVHVNADHGGPHVGLVQGATAPAATVRVHGSGEHTHDLADPAGAGPGVQSHLHVKHPEGHGPTAAGAEHEAHLVMEANAKAGQVPKVPVADTSTVDIEGF